MYNPYKKKKFFVNPHPQSFIIFVYEFQRIEAKRINKLVSLKEAYSGGAVAWKELPESEKKRYERIAASPTWREYKAKYQSYSYNMTFSELEEIEDKRISEESIMLRDIDFIIGKAKSNETVAELRLHFMMANYFVKLNDSEETYIPAEISLSKFSIRDGVLDKFHTFVDPGVLPFGHALQAKEHARSTHQLELPPNAVGEKNLGKIYRNIAKFISLPNGEKNFEKGTELPPVYTDESSIRIVKSILKFCKNDCFDEYIPNIRVYPLQNVFFKMKLASSYIGDTESPHSIKESNENLSKDNYEYEMSLSCKFHENLECAKFCSLSSVTRWSYIFAENICPDLLIKLLPGKHMPSQCDYIVENNDVIEMKPMPIPEQKYQTGRGGRANYVGSFEHNVEDEHHRYQKTSLIKSEEKKVKTEKLDSVYKDDECKYDYDSDIQSIKSLNKSVVSIDSDSENEDRKKTKEKGFKKEPRKEKIQKKMHTDSDFQKKRSRRSRSNSNLSADEERNYFKSLNNRRIDVNKRHRSKSMELNEKFYSKLGFKKSSSKQKLHHEKYDKYGKIERYARSRSRSRRNSRSRYGYRSRSRSRDYKRIHYRSRSRSRDYKKVELKNEIYHLSSERRIPPARLSNSRSRERYIEIKRYSRSRSRSRSMGIPRSRYIFRSRSRSSGYERTNLKDAIIFDREREMPSTTSFSPQFIYRNQNFHYDRDVSPSYISPQYSRNSHSPRFESYGYYSKPIHGNRRNF